VDPDRIDLVVVLDLDPVGNADPEKLEKFNKKNGFLSFVPL
jgi:hypothetical protein